MNIRFSFMTNELFKILEIGEVAKLENVESTIISKINYTAILLIK